MLLFKQKKHFILLRCAARGTCALLTLLLRLCVIRVERLLPVSAPLARTGLKRSDLTALLDFPNVLRPDESNPDDETSHFAAVWTLKKIIQSYRRLFPHEVNGEKSFCAMRQEAAQSPSVPSDTNITTLRFVSFLQQHNLMNSCSPPAAGHPSFP